MQEVSAERLLALINEVRAAVDDAEPPTFFWGGPEWPFSLSLQPGPPYYPGDRHGRPPGRHQHRPALGSGDHQHLPGPPGTPGRGLFGHRREEHIIKPGAPLVTSSKNKYETVPQPLPGELGAPLSQGGLDFKARESPSRGDLGLQHRIPGLSLNLKTEHQYGDAGVALAVVELLSQEPVSLCPRPPSGRGWRRPLAGPPGSGCQDSTFCWTDRASHAITSSWLSRLAGAPDPRWSGTLGDSAGHPARRGIGAYPLTIWRPCSKTSGS